MAAEETLVEEITETAERLVGAFSSHDVVSYFSFFAEDATFIFHNVDQVLRSRADYEQLWAKWETDDGFHIRSCRSDNGAVRILCADGAVFTHDVTTVVTTHEGQETLKERETIVFKRMSDRWLAVHEHLSQ